MQLETPVQILRRMPVLTNSGVSSLRNEKDDKRGNGSSPIHQIMFSGAGHDLMNWGQTVPSMLLFIPSKDGISHSIREYSAPEDLYRGAQLLMEMVQALDQEEGDL